MNKQKTKRLLAAFFSILGLTLVYVLYALHFQHNTQDLDRVTPLNSEPADTQANVNHVNVLNDVTTNTLGESPPNIADENNVDFTALIAISREYELCTAQQVSLQQSATQNMQELTTHLKLNTYTTSELQGILRYLADAKLIDFHQAASTMDYFYLNGSRAQLPAFSRKELNDMSDDHPIKSLFMGISLHLAEQNKAALLAIWKRIDSNPVKGISIGKHKDLVLGQRLSINNRQITFDSLILAGIDKYKGSEFGEWLIDTLALEHSAIALAIDENIADDIILRLLHNSRQPSVAVATRERFVASPLLSAALEDRNELVKALLDSGEFNQPPLTVPPNNRYLAKALLDRNVDSRNSRLNTQQMAMLTLFSSQNRRLALTRDDNNKIRLLGFPFLVINQQVVDQLRDNGILARTFLRSVVPNEMMLPQANSAYLSELVLRMSEQGQLNQTHKSQCQGLRKRQSELMPNYLLPTEVDNVIEQGLEHNEAIQLLRAISPVLVDLYYKNVLIDEFEQASAKQGINKDADKREGELSAVYKAISGFVYDKAIALSTPGAATHGYEHGRDALALLLDHIITQGPTVIEQKRTLLRLLMANTELQDMHFRRLHRFKLKWPAWYEALASEFTQVNLAPDYPVSRYNSY